LKISEKTLGEGAIKKKEGWMVSKYKKAGDLYPTLKIRRVAQSKKAH